jgi:acyl-CoA thioesterase-2
MDFADMALLEPQGADVYVGTGPQYPWGGLYGGQIVAQALRATALTVADGFTPHSLRAYFIRAGDAAEPIRYEVDRTRDGRSFCTRRVVARQGGGVGGPGAADGAILNLEASFHAGEESADLQPVAFERADPPDGLSEDSWTTAFERRFVPGSDAAGRTRCWFRMRVPVGDDPLLHASAFAYISDDLPTDAVVRTMGVPREEFDTEWFSVSLDHTIWFHRPFAADDWHLQDVTCHRLIQGRGLTSGHAFTADGTHVATFAQEVLVRRRRNSCPH